MSDQQPPVAQRLFRGYGPLLGFAAIFLAISLVVPTRADQVGSDDALAYEGAGDLSVEEPEGGDAAALDAAAEPTGTDGPAGAADVGGSSSGAGAGSTAGGGPAGGGSAAGAGGGGGAAASGGTALCGAYQVQGDPYSPPCIRWRGGDNGGATSKGVTKDSIKVAVRIQAFENGVADALSKVAKAKIPNESAAKIENTIRGVTEYFNKYYEFYGRKLDVTIYKGKGLLEREILGGGPEGAAADALKVGTEIKAFADASAVSPPYAEQLTRQRVVNIGAPYLSRDYMTRLRPYAWSQLTDCSTVVETVASYYLARLAGKPATVARGSLADKPRRAAIIAPDNTWYQECVNAGVRIIQQAGKGRELALNLRYRIDINDLLNQAIDLVRKLKAGEVTTVICGCDPILMTYLTAKAAEQGYRPEWIGTGVAFTDLDVVGQIMEQDNFNKAFGISFNGPTVPIRGGPGYRAFKAVRPNEEPAQSADLIFYQLQLLAIGVQMAGPNLTPATFEAGMFRYPARTGPSGTWDFGPRDYTTSQDAREVYYSPSTRSPQNGERGAWIDPSGGRSRFAIGRIPPGNPPVSW